MNKFLKNKADITAWLEQYSIQNYELILDDKYGYAVDVSGDVNLFDKSLNHIPVKFSNVGGYFSCSHNSLTSLEFCPLTIKGSFYCNRNNLTSLEFCPTTIDGDFYCDHNNLISLEFCPKTIGGNFHCENNKITNLIYFPDYIDGGIYLRKNNLTRMDIGRNGYYHFKEILSIRLEHKIAAEQELLENSIINKTPVKIIKQSFKL